MNTTIAGILLLAIFLLMMALMYARKISALLALPLMAIAYGVVAGMNWWEILDVVISQGAYRLHEAYVVALFGGMLAMYVKEKGIAEVIIKYAAELSGDKPLVVGCQHPQ